MDLRLSLALAGARATGFLTRLTRRGGGTAAPGLVAERLDPAALQKLGAAIPDGILIVAGTNGKTTTAHMISAVLAHDRQRVVHNRSGSNLVRGALAALAAQSSLSGLPHGNVGVIEADEAALPALVAALRPRALLLNNLFRDQLDRYGELHTIGRRWQEAITTLNTDALVIVNADDPALVGIVERLPRERLTFFGLAVETSATDLVLDQLPHAADTGHCPRCGATLAYRALYLSHLGDWYCPACGYARPRLDLAASAITLDGMRSFSCTVERSATGETIDLRVPLPGLYNVYNTLAAASAALSLGAPAAKIAEALAGFRAAFGRIEPVALEGRTLVLALVKNPTGCNEVLRALTGGRALTAPTMIVINDRDADGRDVSWLWDVDFEMLAEGTVPLHTAGIRGPDMAVRLKYAGVAPERIVAHPPDNLRDALLDFVRSAPAGATLYLLPTYTAMLELRRALAALGAVEDFWKA